MPTQYHGLVLKSWNLSLNFMNLNCTNMIEMLKHSNIVFMNNIRVLLRFSTDFSR